LYVIIEDMAFELKINNKEIIKLKSLAFFKFIKIILSLY